MFSKSWRAESGGRVFRIGRNATSILVSGALAELINAYTLALSALALGAVGFGRLATAAAFFEPFQTLAMFGLGVISMTLAARRDGVEGALLGTMSLVHGALALASFVLMLAVAWVTAREEMVPLLLLLSVGLASVPINSPSTVPFQFSLGMHRLVAIPTIGALVRLGLTYAAITSLNIPLGHQAAATVAGLVTTALMFWAGRHFHPMSWRVDRELLRQMLALAWPAATLEFVVMIYSRASYFLLHDAGPAVQGQFAVADRLSRPILALSGAIVASSLPSVARLAAGQNAHRLWAVYRGAVLRALLVLVPVGVGAAIAAPWILQTFAPEFEGASTPFQILLVGVFFMFLNQISSMFIIAVGRFRTIMVVALVNLAVYLILASWWIPRYQAVGAAASTTVMEGVNCVAQIVILGWLLREHAGDRGAGEVE